MKKDDINDTTTSFEGDLKDASTINSGYSPSSVRKILLSWWNKYLYAEYSKNMTTIMASFNVILNDNLFLKV